MARGTHVSKGVVLVYLRTGLFVVILTVALMEFSPALFLAEKGILSGESQIFSFIGVSYFMSLFGA